MTRPQQSPEPPIHHHLEAPPNPRPDDENLRRALRLTRVMLALADDGDRDHRDADCAILYGTLRDMAYRLRRMAEDELARHARAGRRD